MWRWILMVAVSGCGSSSDPPVSRLDATPPVDMGCGGVACDAVNQQGCANKKCTWLVDDAELGHGHVACVFSGAVPAGGPCTRDMFGADTCVSGATCYQDRCRVICDLLGPPTNCGATMMCKDTELFHMCASPTALAGLCL